MRLSHRGVSSEHLWQPSQQAPSEWVLLVHFYRGGNPRHRGINSRAYLQTGVIQRSTLGPPSPRHTLPLGVRGPVSPQPGDPGGTCIQQEQQGGSAQPAFLFLQHEAAWRDLVGWALSSPFRGQVTWKPLGSLCTALGSLPRRPLPWPAGSRDPAWEQPPLLPSLLPRAASGSSGPPPSSGVHTLRHTSRWLVPECFWRVP